jgi:hypothetical protein
MKIESIETDKYIMKIDAFNDFLEYSIKAGVTFTPEDAIQAKKEVITRYPEKKFYVLAEGVEFFTLTKEAREHCASKEHLDNVHCVAFYTPNVSLLLLGEIFNKINKPVVTTKFFNNKSSAHEWLWGQILSQGTK